MASPFAREAEYFGFCPLQLTDRFCAAVNGKLVSAVDTFQDWASMNLVRVDEVHARALLLMASQEQLNATGAVAGKSEELTSEQIRQALRDVCPENDALEAANARAIAEERREAEAEAEAEAGGRKSKKKEKKKRKKKKIKHPEITVTAGQVLEAAANLGLDELHDVRDLGQRMGTGVFAEVADACDRLTVGLRAMADKTCDKLELYLLNNVMRIPDDLYVPSLDAEQRQGEVGEEMSSSSSSLSPSSSSSSSASSLPFSSSTSTVYTEEDETAVDDARAVLRDRIVRLRRKNARVARSRADLHLQLEKWQSVMPLVNQVTSRVSSNIDVEDTENNNSASTAGSGPTLSDAVTQVLRDTAQLSAAAEQVQGKCDSFFCEAFFCSRFFCSHLFALLFSLSPTLNLVIFCC
jgi:hypothetical protein